MPASDPPPAATCSRSTLQRPAHATPARRQGRIVLTHFRAARRRAGAADGDEAVDEQRTRWRRRRTSERRRRQRRPAAVADRPLQPEQRAGRRRRLARAGLDACRSGGGTREAAAGAGPAAGGRRPATTGTRPLAVVDYAHTPDALVNVLQALRPIADAARRPALVRVRRRRRPRPRQARADGRGGARPMPTSWCSPATTRAARIRPRSSPQLRGRPRRAPHLVEPDRARAIARRARRRPRCRRRAGRRQGARGLPGDRRACAIRSPTSSVARRSRSGSRRAARESRRRRAPARHACADV